jgi:hypothetical protein
MVAHLTLSTAGLQPAAAVFCPSFLPTGRGRSIDKMGGDSVVCWHGKIGAVAMREEELRDLREHGRTGRPLGSATFLERLEAIAGRILKPQKGGRPPKLRKLPQLVLYPQNPLLY